MGRLHHSCGQAARLHLDLAHRGLHFSWRTQELQGSEAVEPAQGKGVRKAERNEGILVTQQRR